MNGNSILGSTNHEPNEAVQNFEIVRSPFPASTSSITSIIDSDDGIRSTPRIQDPVASESNERDIRGSEKAQQVLELSSQIAQSNNQSVEISEMTRFDDSVRLTTVGDVKALEVLLTRDSTKARDLGRFFTTVFENSLNKIVRRSLRPDPIDAAQLSLGQVFTVNATTFHSWASGDAKRKLRRMKIFDVSFKKISNRRTRIGQETFIALVRKWLRKAAERQAGSASRNTVAEN